MTSNIGRYLIFLVIGSFFIWAGFICYESIPMCREAVLNFSSTGKKNTVIIYSGFLALCGGWGIIQYLGRRFQNLFKLELFFVAGIFSLIIFFSKTFIEIAIFIWIIALSYAFGIRVLRMLLKEWQRPFLETFVFSTGIGLGAFSIGTFFVGLAGLLYSLFIYGILVVLTIVFRNDIKDLYSTIKLSLSKIYNDKQDRGLFPTVILLILLLFVVINFIGALGPEIMYDSLAYHLTCPKAYVESHKIIEIKHPFQSYWPENMEMLFTLGLLLKGQILAKLFEFFFGILTVISIYCLCREFYSTRTGLLASAFFYTCPVVAWESTTTHVELGLTFYCFLAFLACLRFISSQKTHWLIICGILLGVGLGVKYHAVLTFVTIFLLICFYGVHYKMDISKTIKVISLFCLIAFLIALPWYLRPYILTGNPVFPLLNSIFQSPFWPKYNMTYSKAYGMGNSFLDYLKLPWNLTFYGNKFSTGIGGKWELGIVFLMFAPLYLWKRIDVWNLWQGKKQVGAYRNTPLQHPILSPGVGKHLLFYTLIYTFLLFWVFSVQGFRHYIPILPVVSIICASLIDYFHTPPLPPLEEKGRVRVMSVTHALLSLLALSALCANIPFSLSLFWNIPTRIPYKVVFGLESWDDYLPTVFHTYDYKTMQYINDNLDPDVRILSLKDPNGLYCERPFIRNLNPFFASEFSKAKNDRNKLLKFLKKENFTHILINKNERETGWYEGLLNNNDLHLLYTNRRVYLYKILTPKERIRKMAKARINKNLLKNAGFEKYQEKEVEGWRRGRKPILDCSNTYSYDGKCAVFANHDNVYVQSVPVTPGNTYTLSHYSKTGTDRRGIYGRVQINWHAQGGKIIDASISVYEASKDYQKNSMSVTPPEGATFGVIYVVSHGKDSIWFDDFSFVKEGDLKVKREF